MHLSALQVHIATRRDLNPPCACRNVGAPLIESCIQANAYAAFVFFGLLGFDVTFFVFIIEAALFFGAARGFAFQVERKTRAGAFGGLEIDIARCSHLSAVASRQVSTHKGCVATRDHRQVVSGSDAARDSF